MPKLLNNMFFLFLFVFLILWERTGLVNYNASCDDKMSACVHQCYNWVFVIDLIMSQLEHPFIEEKKVCGGMMQLAMCRHLCVQRYWTEEKRKEKKK